MAEKTKTIGKTGAKSKKQPFITKDDKFYELQDLVAKATEEYQQNQK